MGIQDFELISLVRQKAQTDAAMEQALDAAFACVLRSDLAGFTNVKDKKPESLYSLDPADYAAARGLLIGALTGLFHSQE
jgi:hypothetical protein